MCKRVTVFSSSISQSVILSHESLEDGSLPKLKLASKCCTGYFKPLLMSQNFLFQLLLFFQKKLVVSIVGNARCRTNNLFAACSSLSGLPECFEFPIENYWWGKCHWWSVAGVLSFFYEGSISFIAQLA